jgi:transposase
VAIISAQDVQGDLHILAVLPDRLKATLVSWLEAMPVRIRACITTVCTDIWAGYITAVQEVHAAATIVIDRFHVARHYRDSLSMLAVARYRWYTDFPDEYSYDDLSDDARNPD